MYNLAGFGDLQKGSRLTINLRHRVHISVVTTVSILFSVRFQSIKSETVSARGDLVAVLSLLNRA